MIVILIVQAVALYARTVKHVDVCWGKMKLLFPPSFGFKVRYSGFPIVMVFNFVVHPVAVPAPKLDADVHGSPTPDS